MVGPVFAVSRPSRPASRDGRLALLIRKVSLAAGRLGQGSKPSDQVAGRTAVKLNLQVEP
ncbi:uncharacterized protein PGTG_22470 [Puccinia graminis f. sp. tritici CRL 75-36-700-3]|uniref:Uncharacterized protein n=1 Tax=Puccinia graminis f. sp. tritici (strain CRL 75-36-700-3 / race SCCL) TaxID=418459 RepID=H6QUQ9_PUCGT|nr:uncharacterized protein PGTG_22470 [Puccinia graminis f. sp. tritici CRL 75-36-700-3]EHS64771.1 hypothetical protein PGTG_22470 [Puccinia graminis f. sp. tritici CRL 75-36-700-3]